MIMRRYRPLLLLLLALCISCADSGTRKQTETVDVLDVVDGDTILLTDGRKVRYIGVNTPERDQPFYNEATQLNRELVYGKTVTLHFSGRRTDRYGRTLAMVYVDDIRVGDSLIAAGLAVVYGFPDNAKFLPPLVATQRAAMDRRIGLWPSLLEESEDYYIGSITGYRFHRPNCASVPKIKHDHRIQFDSKYDAYYDGYAPCNRCTP